MDDWLQRFNYNPIDPLLQVKNPAVNYFAEQLAGNSQSAESLWNLPKCLSLVRRQQSDGSWRYPGGGKPNIRSSEDYDQIETYRNLGELIEKYGLNKKHSAIQRAASFLFSHQTQEGDFRGIYGTQYSPNYSAAIMELLIKAGYGDDKRIEKGFEWLLYIRQFDGGWVIPMRTTSMKSWSDAFSMKTVFAPDRTKPFSHLVTGVVLRAFAAHEKYRQTQQAHTSARLLTSRFFKRDVYIDRQGTEYWFKFSYPFWFTDLLSSLDSLSLIGFQTENPQIKKALEWFKTKQTKEGIWHLKKVRGKDKDLDSWLSLAICRVFKRLR